MIDTNTQILIERSLRGDLNNSETADLQALLAQDDESRRYLAEVRSALDLLQGMEQSGLDKVDWKRIKRGTWRFLVRRNLGIAFNGGMALWALYLGLSGASDTRWLGITLGFLVFSMRAWSEYIEQRSFVKRVDHASHAEDYMERYAAVLRREWKKWRSTASGEILSALFLLILAAIGKYGMLCSTLALCFVVSALAHHHFIVKPLRQEMKELGA